MLEVLRILILEFFDATIAVSMQWNDHRLKWDTEEYGRVQLIRVRKEEVWTPDLHIVNRIHDFAKADETTPKCKISQLKPKLLKLL